MSQQFIASPRDFWYTANHKIESRGAVTLSPTLILMFWQKGFCAFSWMEREGDCKTESIKWCIEDQASWPSYDLATPPPLPPSPVRKLPLFLSLPMCRRSSLLMEEGGTGWGRSQIIGLRESMVLYKSFKTLSCKICPVDFTRYTVSLAVSMKKSEI